ncbi:MAG: hypothetical protein E7307_02185 [Butyrivibrio sp.]|nr:hypothetical protein [Butyrivibrio sp.]
MNLKKYCKIVIIAIGLTVLTACGKKSDPELENYREKMEEFYSSLSYYDQAINALDPEADGSKEELLKMLDQMNESYKDMASLEVPEEFSGISDLPGEAADYMQKADDFYHMAYDGDFDEDNEALASQYYERANNRAMVILQVLHGEVPSVEGVSVDE